MNMKKEYQTPIVRFSPLKLLIRNLLYRVTPDDEIVSPDFEPTERTVIKADYSRILHDSPPDKFLREYAVWDINKIEKINDKI